MRLIVHGQQAFGKAVLEALLERGEQVVGVYSAPDKEGRPDDPLKALAVESGLPIFQPASYKSPEVWEQMRSLNADLCVMAYVLLMVPEEALNVPTLGSIQYHPSLLPAHRGPSSINWPIIAGKDRSGLTIFWPDNGLDTGPVLLQKEVEITPDDTLGSVYFNKLFPMGVEAMLEAVDMVRDGTAPRIVQDESQATYESWCKRSDVEVDWSKPAQDIHNLIRGANPQPGAWTKLGELELGLFDCKISDGKVGDGAGQTPGQVTAIGASGITVATTAGSIELQRVRPAGGAKVAASEFAASNSLQVGDKLG
ncbi:MAG: methionyl-tRNA formyltransferase [Chromatiales bacterium]|jgi:methionyl-tRNA formyltransferase|nr:methionyl-tRNA formyltransferase [Chromatiales bacterium]